MAEEAKKTRVVVVGGGPGGYVAAIRAAQLGADVTLVEKAKLGGTCLNVGCIPTKAMLHAAEFAKAPQDAAEWGVYLTLDKLDFGAVVAQKTAVCSKLTGGVAALLKSSKVRVINGEAHFIAPRKLSVCKEDGSSELIEGERIILATGSVPVIPPIDGLRESKYMIDSTGALSLSEVPESLLVIGGGVIGVELACAYCAFGSKVTIIEALPRLCPTIDYELGDLLRKELEKQGIEILTGYKVTRVIDKDTCAEVTAVSETDTRTIPCTKLLAALGRRPYTDDLNLDACGIRYERSKVLVDEYLQTNVAGVYAIGDCVGKIMLAHTASAQGETAAENALGEKNAYAPACVPSCFYTFPEVASTGFTEEQAKERGITYHVGRFPLSANGRSLILNGGNGMIKVIVGDELNEVLGVHIIGPSASELVNEANLLITMEGTAAEDLLSIHAHPSVSEAIREAFLASEGRAIHIPNKKK